MPTEDQKRTAHQVLVTRVLEGDGRASRAERRAAFENAGLPEPLRTLLDKVAKQPMLSVSAFCWHHPGARNPEGRSSWGRLCPRACPAAG